jgi:hypothetical protein
MAQLRDSSVEDPFAGRSISQVRGLCNQRGIMNHKSVAVLLQHNESEVELDLNKTKGEDMRE